MLQNSEKRCARAGQPTSKEKGNVYWRGEPTGLWLLWRLYSSGRHSITGRVVQFLKDNPLPRNAKQIQDKVKTFRKKYMKEYHLQWLNATIILTQLSWTLYLQLYICFFGKGPCNAHENRTLYLELIFWPLTLTSDNLDFWFVSLRSFCWLSCSYLQ